MKKVLVILCGLAAALVLCVGALLAYLTINEYRPAQTEALELHGAGTQTPAPGDTLRVLTLNTGYGALGRDADFFADGGKSVHPKDRATVESNLAGLASILAEAGADVCFLQEVDADSRRSFGIDERALLAQPEQSWSHALNYSCDFVPYPLPPIGRVHSGLMLSSVFTPAQSQRLALPCPFSWPVRTANLKRCLLVQRIDMEPDRQLVLIDLHLEAYDDGSGKTAQLRVLADLCQSEYEKGNYVIAGGDFNSRFPGADPERYPLISTENFTPGTVDMSLFSEDWQIVYDESVPT